MAKSKLPVVGDVVECEWLDAHANAQTELSQDEVDKTGSYKFSTYGILARDDRAKPDRIDPVVAVATEVGEDGLYRGVTFIPTSIVVSLRRVQAGRHASSRMRKVPSHPATVLPV